MPVLAVALSRGFGPIRVKSRGVGLLRRWWADGPPRACARGTSRGLAHGAPLTASQPPMASRMGRHRRPRSLPWLRAWAWWEWPKGLADRWPREAGGPRRSVASRDGKASRNGGLARRDGLADRWPRETGWPRGSLASRDGMASRIGGLARREGLAEWDCPRPYDGLACLMASRNGGLARRDGLAHLMASRKGGLGALLRPYIFS